MEDKKNGSDCKYFSIEVAAMFSTMFLVLNNALIYMSELFLECPFPKIYHLLPALICWDKATKLF